MNINKIFLKSLPFWMCFINISNTLYKRIFWHIRSIIMFIWIIISITKNRSTRNNSSFIII
jgi:hypothetical protein